MGQHINLCPVKTLCTTAPSSTNAASIAHPITAEVIVSDGTNWAIKYSDGWIEQGGYKAVSSIASYGTVDITFNTTINNENVAFTAAPVHVHCTPVYTGTTGNDFTPYGVEAVSDTGFKYRKTFSNTTLSGFYWTARGL